MRPVCPKIDKNTFSDFLLQWKTYPKSLKLTFFLKVYYENVNSDILKIIPVKAFFYKYTFINIFFDVFVFCLLESVS